MPGSNQFKAFATGGGANALTPSAYAALATLIANGFQSGTASSQQINTVFRQASFVVSAIAQAIADTTGAAVNDDGVIANFENQFLAMLQGASYTIPTVGGTVNAITGTFVPAITTVTNGMILFVRAAGANTTTTPTFQADATTARTIVKGNNLPLAVGDIAGAGHWLELQYDTGLLAWVLKNPATGVTAPASYKDIQPITASVAGSALTVGLNPTTLDFRSSSLAVGVPNTRSNSAALSLVVPSGASLGTVAATMSRIILLAIDNAGTMELAVVNIAGGNDLTETGLISTTAISAAATANNVVYSTTARTSVAYRVIGYVESTQATAGTWATAPSTIQGYGGQALSAMSSAGYGQTQQNVIGSRVSGTTYYNTTGKPISAFMYSGVGASGSVSAYINGNLLMQQTASSGQILAVLLPLIPPGASYQMTSTSAITAWWEQR